MTLPKTAATVSPRTQADEAWKCALDCWFQSFLFCFWPDIAEQIDWHAPINEISQKLPSVTGTSASVGKQVVDKLYRLTYKSHKPILILLHVEIQGNKENDFSKRMLKYGCKLYLKYDLPIVPLVVLSDDYPNWHPTQFELTAAPKQDIYIAFARLSY